jgi:hypothetical protein
MRPTVDSSPGQTFSDVLCEFRAPTNARLLGGWMCVVGTMMFIFLASSGTQAGIIAGTVGIAVSFCLGLRGVRVAVVCRPDELVVRNRYRTRRIPWVEVAALGFCERDMTFQWRMRDRGSGFVNKTDGELVFLDATETFRYLWPYGYLSWFTLPKPEAYARVAAIKECWLSVVRDGYGRLR